MLELRELIDFWNNYETSTQSNSIHPDDISFIESFKDRILFNKFDSYEEEINNLLESENTDRKFLATLPPGPYLGDLKNAKLFFLLINPGFGYMSYYEARHTEIQKEIYKTIYQKNLDKDYPFFLLNPKFLWTAGGQYWHKKFHRLITEISISENKTYLETLKMFAKNIAAIELIPYPSKNIGHISKSMIHSLKSTEKALNFVKKLAEQQDILIVVMRQARNWEIGTIDKNKIKAKILTFGANQDQSASLNPQNGNGQKVKNEIISMLRNQIITF